MRRLRIALLALAAFAGNAAAQLDANLQNLLTSLTQGTEATLVSPLADGQVLVTSFTPPVRLTPFDAMTVLERARGLFASLGVAQPTGEQLAIALIGGTVDVPTGRLALMRMLPAGGTTVPLRSQTMAASDVAARNPLATGNTQALALAAQQLAQVGIANPTPQQLQTALTGGVIALPNGAFLTLPGTGTVAGTAIAPSPVFAPGVRPTVPAR